jgi:hypothetical protein
MKIVKKVRAILAFARGTSTSPLSGLLRVCCDMYFGIIDVVRELAESAVK